MDIIGLVMGDKFCRIKAGSVIHPLGFSPEELFEAVKSGKTALQQVERPYLEHPVFAALFSDDQNEIIHQACPHKNWTRFEKILWLTIKNVLDEASLKPGDEELLFVVASTKGSIEEIKCRMPEELTLSHSINKVLQSFHAAHPPLIISNACISGLSAIIAGANFLQDDRYKYIVAVGADTISDFILSGFNSLMALSSGICRPFDVNRKGINLGEGAAAIVMGKSGYPDPGLYYTGGAITNDANHISGPSRTGEELAFAIETALKQADIIRPDFVSAHGTGTLFNDEMESKALTMNHLENIPTHSLKAHLGHTLGTAGILESIFCLRMLETGILIPSAGYQAQGTSLPLNIQQTMETKPLANCLKTMSGFGGCNAAACFQKLTN